MNDDTSRIGGLCAIATGISSVLVGISWFFVVVWMFRLGYALIAIFSFGAIPAITALVRPLRPFVVTWVSHLALLGAATLALVYIAKADIDETWLFFGGTGVWVLVVNLLAMRHNLWPRLLIWIGVAGSVMIMSVVPANMLGNETIEMIAAAAGALLLVPIWFIWLGTIMTRSTLKPVPSGASYSSTFPVSTTDSQGISS